MNNAVTSTINFFTSLSVSTGGLGTAWNVIRTVFIVADVLLAFGFIFALFKAFRFRPKLHVHGKRYRRTITLQHALFKKKWQEIAAKFSPDSADAVRLSVIEADSLADQVLKRIGLQGEHMADRMMKLNPDEVTTLNRLWRAHKLRNEIVHTPGFTVSASDAKQALEDFGSFFKEIGMLN